MTPTKETNKVPRTDANKMEIYELSDKEFKIILLRKSSKIQEHTHKQLNKIKKTAFMDGGQARSQREVLFSGEAAP